jgi:transcriptional regulator with XRE-family HTH domain
MCVDLGLSKSMITKLKADPTRGINADTAQKIADYFGVSVDRVLGNSGQQKKPVPTDEDELNYSLIRRLTQLTPEELEKVDAFVQGLLAAR